MARKRSLKDAAADQLVEKNTAVPKDPAALAAAPADEPAVVPPAPDAPAAESPARIPPPVEAPMAIDAGRKGCPSALWRAILIAIGFAAGFFFGIGQAVGAANMAFLVIGVAGGAVLGRFFIPSSEA
ncbi:MAG TPA: hypothetical protein VN300_09285 [Desulfobacterales bacterium]|nr:hypothetical protein [Desulfobacterales bacterium]